MKFADLKLSEPLLRAITAEGYTTATPIQSEAIPHILEGRDIFGCAQTGTGKTAAFALPMLDRLTNSTEKNSGPRRIRAVIMAPTRELALQIGESFRTYGKFTHLRHVVIFGGVSQVHQVRSLQSGVDILVATPGRLLDLMNQGYVDLSQVQLLTLDEADQMLDMGFIPDLRRIVSKVPRSRQTLFFSATLPPEIRRLVAEWLRDPVTVNVVPPGTTVKKIEQSVYMVEKQSKSKLLVQYLKDQKAQRTLVFTRTKHGADKLVYKLIQSGIHAEAIHSNKSQNARRRAIEAFKSKKPPVLVATDIASRGLDIDNVSHVVNFDLPQTPEAYVHRIGRTGRAGAEGIAITLCDREERSMLREIQRLTRQDIRVAVHQSSTEVSVSADEPDSRRRDRNDRGDSRGSRDSRDGRGDRRSSREDSRGPRQSRSSDRGPHRSSRPAGERSPSDQPRSDRVRNERPQGESTRAPRAVVEARTEEKRPTRTEAAPARAERSPSDSPRRETTRSERPQGERSSSNHSNSDRSVSGRLANQRQSGPRSSDRSNDRSSSSRPASGESRGKSGKMPWYMREKVAGPSRSERVKKEIKEVQSVSRWKEAKGKKKAKTGRVIAPKA